MGPRLAPAALLVLLAACAPAIEPTAPPASNAPASASQPTATSTATAASARIEHDGIRPVVTGDPIPLAELEGRIVTDDFEDVFAFDPDGSSVVTIAGEPGPEFDGAWSPDGAWVVYRDSTRGINENDEIFVARADGSERRNITNNPANDWGPDWSPDGTTIVFNSDRDGQLAGFLMDPDGGNLRRIETAEWFEYPSWSPDGSRIVFEGHAGNNYDLYVLELASEAVTRLTNVPGNDSWPAWSPDGTTIAFSSHRDDCRIAAADQECWRSDEPQDEHSDIWLIAPDGSNVRRVNGENGQFVAWSPDSRYLLVSGRALYVVRPDGTGRHEIRADGINLPLGGIPDWIAAAR